MSSIDKIEHALDSILKIRTARERSRGLYNYLWYWDHKTNKRVLRKHVAVLIKPEKLDEATYEIGLSADRFGSGSASNKVSLMRAIKVTIRKHIEHPDQKMENVINNLGGKIMLTRNRAGVANPKHLNPTMKFAVILLRKGIKDGDLIGYGDSKELEIRAHSRAEAIEIAKHRFPGFICLSAKRKLGTPDPDTYRYMNPGTNWHVDRANELIASRIKTKGIRERDKINSRVFENYLAAEESRRLGMNPTPKYKKPFKSSFLPMAAVVGLVWWLLKK